MAKLLQILACILIVNTLRSEATTCEYNPDTCECRHEDELILDLHQLVPSTLKISSGNVNYEFSGCKDKVDCGKSGITALCRSESQLDKDNKTVIKQDSLGHGKQVHIAQSVTKLGSFDVFFNDTKTAISLICSEYLSKPTFAFIEEDLKSDKIKYEFVVFSPHACKIIPHPGLSTGSKLLLIFFIFMLIYFTLGAVVLYFVRGARGLEIIPNIDFWRGLPSLVRDGALFLMNGCNPITVPTAEAYDRI